MHDQTQGRPPEGDWLGTPYVRFERKGSLASCIVDRPEARNAMTGAMYFAVRYAVDQKTASAADSLAAIVLKGYGGLALSLEIFVEQIEHLQERHVRRHTLHLVGGECTGHLGVLLPPDFECEVHGYL